MKFLEAWFRYPKLLKQLKETNHPYYIVYKNMGRFGYSKRMHNYAYPWGVCRKERN